MVIAIDVGIPIWRKIDTLSWSPQRVNGARFSRIGESGRLITKPERENHDFRVQS
jgi:hypothetical protein